MKSNRGGVSFAASALHSFRKITTMKKTYPLASTSHKLPRVIELIKSDVRKYIKRERRKKLPKGADFWDFDCRVGADSETAANVHIAEINGAIDRAGGDDGDGEGASVYIEILAKGGHRTRKPKVSAEDDPVDENREP